MGDGKKEKEVRKWQVWGPVLDERGLPLPLADAQEEYARPALEATTKAQAVNTVMQLWWGEAYMLLNEAGLAFTRKKWETLARKSIVVKLVPKPRPKKVVLVTCAMCEQGWPREAFVRHVEVCERQRGGTHGLFVGQSGVASAGSE